MSNGVCELMLVSTVLHCGSGLGSIKGTSIYLDLKLFVQLNTKPS